MTQLVSDVFLTEDGHAQERSLIAEMLETVLPEDLYWNHPSVRIVREYDTLYKFSMA